MSLQFILGNSGSGKTEYIFAEALKEAKANPKKNYLIMAPEQSTIALQKKLVDQSADGVIMNVDVLGFTRLAYRIFDELGMTSLTVLEETGKNLVLRKIAQEKESKLTVLRPNLNRMGYINELKSLMSEFSQYHVTPERIDAFLNQEKCSKVLAAKLKDIQTMQRGFSDFMENRFITQEELLDVFCKVAPESEILKNSVLVFDDYTGFTPLQLRVLRTLLPIVERVQICMTIDAKDVYDSRHNKQDLFDMPKTAMDKLYALCTELKVEIVKPIVLDGGSQKRFKNAPDLFFMEQNLFRPTYQKSKGKPSQLRMLCAQNPREELLVVAREIARLIREENYQYGDVAVVTGTLDNYANYADAIFGKYQIPFFVDKTTEIVFHPFIEFVRASLEVIEQDFSYESLFRFLRCGFTDFTEDEIDQLENYILAVGIRGNNAWSKRFARLPKQNKNIEIEKIEEMRKLIYDAFAPLVVVFQKKNKATVREQITALYNLIVGFSVEEQLWEKQEAYEEAGMTSKAKEYEQIYGKVMGLFDKVVGVLGEEKMEIQDFIEVLEAGLSAAKVATLPPGKDTVVLGDIERTRLNQVKVLFFIGVNDGVIPKSGNNGGIISEYERTLLADGEVELAPSARDQVFIQKYYLYLNLTKPSEKLYMSYCLTDAEGKGIRPSYLIGTIKKIFPEMQVEVHDEELKQINLSTKEAAMDYLVHGKRDENWYALMKYFQMDSILEASNYHYADEPISRAVAQAIYGTTMKGSVTRLEQFARCAYSHFLKYGLRLNEREESGFATVDVGNLYHEALQKYSEKLKASEYDWFKVPDQVRDELAMNAMEEAIAEYPALTTYATAESTYQVERMKGILKRTVWALTEQVRRGSFVPTDFEVSFSQEEAKDAVSFHLSDREKLELSGRIDRLDIYEDPEHVYIKVIDYKSGSSKFELVKIYQGLQLQLAMYLNAASQMMCAFHPNKEVVPGGLFYYNIDEPAIETDQEMSEEEYQKSVLKELKPNGPVNREEEVYRLLDANFEGSSDVMNLKINKDGSIAKTGCIAYSSEDFTLIGEYVNELVQREAKDIYQGKVSVNPYQEKGNGSCSYCPYQSVCGLDMRIDGYAYRKLESPDKDEIFEKMQTDIALMKAEKERG